MTQTLYAHMNKKKKKKDYKQRKAHLLKKKKNLPFYQSLINPDAKTSFTSSPIK
jgi:hypothetical protein